VELTGAAYAGVQNKTVVKQLFVEGAMLLEKRDARLLALLLNGYFHRRVAQLEG
jgi:hypothetical protein